MTINKVIRMPQGCLRDKVVFLSSLMHDILLSLSSRVVLIYWIKQEIIEILGVAREGINQLFSSKTSPRVVRIVVVRLL